MATMERPRPSSEEEEAPAVSSTSAPAKEESKKTEAQPLPGNPEEAVEALEKRLEGLGGTTAPVSAEEVKTPAAPAAAPAAAKGAPSGKNALLVSSSWFVLVRMYNSMLCD